MWIKVDNKIEWKPDAEFRQLALDHFEGDDRMSDEDRDLIANSVSGCASATLRYAEMAVSDLHSSHGFREMCKKLLRDYFRDHDSGRDNIKVHYIEQNGPCIARYCVKGYGVLKSRIPANKKVSDHLPRIRRRFVEERGWVPPRYKGKPFLRDLKRAQLRNRARRERENAS